MASRRSLGGGRILGSSKTLSPAVAASQRPGNNSLLSPSESSISLSSQTSSTPVSTDLEDISARVALDEHGPSAAATASSKLMCPICNEEMVCGGNCLVQDHSANDHIGNPSTTE